MDRRRFLVASAVAAGTALLPRCAPEILAASKSQSTARAVGAEIPWHTYPAAEMKTTGIVLGPKYDPNLIETESTSQRCVKLAPSQYVEFIVKNPANAMVIRYSLPDSDDGAGIDSTLTLSINGKLQRTVPVTSRYSWLYGVYPFANDPEQGKPRNFYDEVRLKALKFKKGDVVSVQNPADAATYCIVDLIDLETVPALLPRPAGSISLGDFGAVADGRSDDTEPLRKALSDAAREASPEKRIVWIPPGDYKLTGDIIVPSDITIQGAGMWHTTFAGDDNLYHYPNRRLRFQLTGSNSHLADFALLGRLNYRKDDEQNDGVFGAHATNCTISRLWIEHTKVGMWFYVCDHVVIEGCRLRNTLADGINFCVGVRNSLIQNCTARNTGDDCFAIWPAASDQGFVQERPSPGNNVIRSCTGQTPFLANGAAIYGGANNRIEDSLFTDIAVGSGILLSTTFPTSDEARHIDNNFSGTTIVRKCDLIRCGGFDHGWRWRGAIEICLHRRSISGLLIRDIRILDSISNGFDVIAPGSQNGQGTLSDTQLEGVDIPDHGIGTPSHGLWIREDVTGGLSITHSNIPDIRNSSTKFHISAK